MKSFLAILFLALAAQAHASTAAANGGHHGGLGSAMGASTSSPAAAASGGNGGRYSVVDEYQPWPQAEMTAFAKPHWIPFDGKK